MTEQFPLTPSVAPVNFANYLFGLLSQSGAKMTLHRVADDAATIVFNGQAFTVTVTASRPKQAAPMAYSKPAVVKRGKDGA